MTAGAMLAAAGLGFAGYVYAVPYHSLSRAVQARDTELGQERSASADLLAEVEKLRTEVGERQGAEQEKVATAAKRKQAIEALVAEVKDPLAAFGGSAAAVDGKAMISLSSSATFEQPTSTVISTQGEAALKVLAAAMKKLGFHARVKAKLIQARPPRELSQFQNLGEFVMLRAVRVALALANEGVAADRIAAAGEEPPAASRSKGKPPVPDRLDVEVEPE